MAAKKAGPSVTIALLNMKGGVGKTTLAFNLAWELFLRQDKSVLLIDLDPQFNASQYEMEVDEWDSHRKKNGTIADVLLDGGKTEMTLSKGKKKPPASVIKKAISRRLDSSSGAHFDFVPAELDLALAIKNPNQVAYKLEKALAEVRANYDYVIIDCAPTDSILTDAALMASDYVLVPMRPDRFSILGYAQIGHALQTFRNAYPDPHNVQDLGVVFTMVSSDSTIEQECIHEVEKKADFVFQTRIPHSKTYARAIKEHAPIVMTKRARKITKRHMRDLVNEIQARIQVIAQAKHQKKA